MASAAVTHFVREDDLLFKPIKSTEIQPLPTTYKSSYPLKKYMQNELLFRGRHQNLESPQDSCTITSGMRDGSAHVLRCLKVWYDLPSDVFFNALSRMDRFLTKMKAQPKHLSCIAVSAFHLSCTQLEDKIKSCSIKVPDADDLVTISQSRCSSSDLMRMQDIMSKKLTEGFSSIEEITHLTMLKLMFSLAKEVAIDLKIDSVPDNLPEYLISQLEVLTCDSRSLLYSQSDIALALLAVDFKRRCSVQECASLIYAIENELTKISAFRMTRFNQCLTQVVSQLEKYNQEGTVIHRQRLVWKVSKRTLRKLRPTDNFRVTLPTIEEYSLNRLRSNSECSEESMDCLSYTSESDFERDIEMEYDEN